jgi:hypothetical protein
VVRCLAVSVLSVILKSSESKHRKLHFRKGGMPVVFLHIGLIWHIKIHFEWNLSYQPWNYKPNL